MVEKKFEPPATSFEPSTAMPKLPSPAMMGEFDLSKIFNQMKVPAMPDMSAVLATHKRNLEAVSEANRVAMDGAQAVARRHFEIVQSMMTGMAESMKAFSVTEAPAERAAKQADMLKQAYEKAVANARELGDLIQKSNTEAAQRLNARFSEAMTEMKALFKKP